MRGFVSYMVAGALVLLALDFIAPPVGLGLAIGAWPAVEHTVTVQTVDRSNKGDRLNGATTVGKQQPAPAKSPIILVGCEPVFSPLSASARANIAVPNIAGRCVV
jgi:hypothetical protein